MKEFDYIIIGGGCAGLSLAYELEIHKKLENKTLAIIEPRSEYKRDKTWSFWKVSPHNFDDCVKKSWNNFHVKSNYKKFSHNCSKYPYQAIDSNLFYKKILNVLKNNKNIHFFKNIEQINSKNSFIFNSVLKMKKFDEDKENYWQHFYGIEIETKKDLSHYDFLDDFESDSVQLMGFDTVYNIVKSSFINFMYILPFEKNKVFLETTWISKGGKDNFSKYEYQILEQLRRWSIIDNPFTGSDEVVDQRINSLMEGKGSEKFKINYKEHGAIPLFHPINEKKINQINIGTAGGMTRLSTGYTFLNIQEQSKYIRENIENIRSAKIFTQNKKYLFLDNTFMKVLDKNPEEMSEIFLKMFNGSTNTIIKFLSNKSNFLEDLLIILKMPKWIFIKALFR